MNLEGLEKPFASSLIKKRKGPAGKLLDYVEVGAVIHRLNAATEGKWSYEVKETTVHEKAVIVLGRMTCDGESREDFGGKVARSDDASLVDAYKAANSDAIKRCARLFGVGLHLYFDDDEVQVKVAPLLTREQSTKIDELLEAYGKPEAELEPHLPKLIGRATKIDELSREEADTVIRFLSKKVQTIQASLSGGGDAKDEVEEAEEEVKPLFEEAASDEESSEDTPATGN
jgi:hypothetical protein